MSVLSNRDIREIAGFAVGVLLRDEWSGIQNASNRHLVEQRRDSSHMVAVIVRDDERVDPFDACILHRRHDALGITARRIQIARIQQQGLLGPEYAVGG